VEDRDSGSDPGGKLYREYEKRLPRSSR